MLAVGAEFLLWVEGVALHLIDAGKDGKSRVGQEPLQMRNLKIRHPQALDLSLHHALLQLEIAFMTPYLVEGVVVLESGGGWPVDEEEVDILQP